MGGKKLPPDYAHLEQLSTEELKEIIRADAESTSGGDEDFIFTVLEVIAEREARQPDYQPPDSDAAWKRFEQYYNTPDGVGQSLFPVEGSEVKRSQPVERVRHMGWPRWKRLAIIAAAIAILLAGVFTAQAAGIDIPGIIARWTDDVFYFEGSATETSGQTEWTEDLIEHGVISKLKPAWIPEGFEAEDQIINDLGTFTEIYQTYHADDGASFMIVAIIYESDSYISQNLFEKNAADVAQDTYNGEKLYLFSNSGNNAAVCWGKSSEVSIIGKLSFDELTKIFNSMGEDPT